MYWNISAKSCFKWNQLCQSYKIMGEYYCAAIIPFEFHGVHGTVLDLHKSEPSPWVLHHWSWSVMKQLGLQMRRAQLSLSVCSGGSEPAEGGGAAVQLHPAQLLGVAARGAQENGHHLLAAVSAGEALWWKLCLLSAELQRVPVCANKSHQKIPRGMRCFYICMFGNTESQSGHLFLIIWMYCH